AMASALAALPAVARTALPAIVAGESGTGKELVARAVHALSRRRGPFLAVNCAPIAQTLLESGLFGPRRGALSGGPARRPGPRRRRGGALLRRGRRPLHAGAGGPARGREGGGRGPGGPHEAGPRGRAPRRRRAARPAPARGGGPVPAGPARAARRLHRPAAAF